MRKIIVTFLWIVLILLLVSCQRTTAFNASPENIYADNNKVDFIVYNDTAYVNSGDVNWIKDLNLKCENELGSIRRTKVTKNYKNYDATILKIGTKIYSVTGREDIILVLINNEYIPYYAYVEG